MSDAPREEGREQAAAEEKAGPQPANAQQRSRFPFLEHFAAGGLTHDQGKTLAGYRISFGLRIGLATGKTYTLTIPKGCTGAHLAQLLRQMADSVAAMVEDCDTAEKQGELTPDLKTAAPRKAPECAVCASKDQGRHATCKRPGCPMAALRELMVAGPLCRAAPPAPWCGPCSTSYTQQPGCPTCAALAAQHARMYGPSTDLPTGAASNDEAQGPKGH